ncbi:hypothetical protein G6F22_017651 [Rhizopus arrhizus]|nr:hypothetical protein G6F22_017651 [Rhizopus arrhizus]
MHQPDQAASLHVPIHEFPFHQPHRPAVDHGLHHVAGFGEGDATAVVKAIDAGCRHPHRPIRPHHAARFAVHVAKRVCKQVARCPQRRAGPPQRRAAYGNHLGMEQAMCNRPLVFPRAETDRDVDIVSVKIPHLVADVERQFQPRMRGTKLRQPGQQPVGGKARPHRQAQMFGSAAHTPGFGSRALQRLQRIGCRFEQDRAGGPGPRSL